MRAILPALALLAAPAHADESQCLAQAASRYFGETERNISRTFPPAVQRDVVLSFDEADALFGRSTDSGTNERTSTRDAHDRYANQEVSYLIARLERFEGVVLLASNHRQRTLIAGFDRASRRAGIIVLETETGVRAIEFTHAARAEALRYARETLRVCPVGRLD